MPALALVALGDHREPRTSVADSHNARILPCCAHDRLLRQAAHPPRPHASGRACVCLLQFLRPPTFQRLPLLVNEWAAELPQSEQAELRHRMSKGTDQQFYAALAELLIHAMFVRLGHEVELHPKIEGTSRRPDFLVRSADGSILAYIEVTTYGPMDEEIAKAKRAAAVEKAVANAKLPPGCRLGYHLRAATDRMPRLNSLVADIERWASDAADISEQVFQKDGWSIELSLHRGFSAEVPTTGVIAASSGEVRWLSAAREIRGALETKASHYGALAAPYMVAVVDCRDEIVSSARDELTEALLGDEVVEDQLSASEAVRTYLVRRGGFWFKGRKPVHANVSAVLLLPRAGLWHLREPEWAPFMARNPWAEHPLPTALLPLPGFAARDDKWTFLEGTSAADILGLPQEWPPRRD